MIETKQDERFFSIIVPTYNRSARLCKALGTIQEQQFKNYEVIVVDDGSTDNTKSAIAEMMQTDSRIKYFYKKNEERSIARNFGIMQATGRYIGFLDSDDILHPNHLSIAHQLLSRNHFPEVGHLGYQFIDESGKPLLIRNTFDNSFKEKLIRENIIHGNAIFIRREIAREIHFIPSSSAILSEDWYVWLRLAARYPFHFDNSVTSSIVQHDTRSLMNIDPDKLIASTDIIVEYLKKDSQFIREYKKMLSYHFANHYTFLTLILSLTKSRRTDTVKYLLRAMSYDLSVIFRKRFLASIKHIF